MTTHNKTLLLPLALLAILPACSADKRDRLWQKYDPAGYKHAHSEVFNPHGYQRYQRRTEPTVTVLDEAEIELR